MNKKEQLNVLELLMDCVHQGCPIPTETFGQGSWIDPFGYALSTYEISIEELQRLNLCTTRIKTVKYNGERRKALELLYDNLTETNELIFPKKEKR